MKNIRNANEVDLEKIFKTGRVFKMTLDFRSSKPSNKTPQPPDKALCFYSTQIFSNTFVPK